MAKEDGTTSWVQDEVYLSRVEGGRVVHRKNEIFDLNTSYQILLNYRRCVPPDFKMVLKRLEELIKEEKDCRINGLKSMGGVGGLSDESLRGDEELLKFLLDLQEDGLGDVNGESDEPAGKSRKRIILNYNAGVFELVSEGEEEIKQEKWSRAMFHLAPRELL